ncbi:MAG: sugar ABC transporter substrate-binding protein [Candidatus Methanomethylicaceae archaeon]
MSFKRSKAITKTTAIIIAIIIIIVAIGATVYYVTLPKPPIKITVIAFAQGFAWPELFGPDGTTETDRLKAFEKEEGIDVVIEWGDETAVREKVAADVAAHTGKYDIVLVGTDGALQTYAYAGLLEPLDDYFTKYPSKYFDPKDCYPVFLDANRVEGVLYALPYYSFGPAIMYREDLFKKYGVSIPRTIDELFEACEKLKQGFERDGLKDIYPITLRAAPGEEPSLDLCGFVYAYAGYVAWFENGAVTPSEIKAKKAKPILDKNGFAEGFKAFVEMCKKYCPPGVATHTWADMMYIYSEGKAAMIFPAINGYAATGITKLEEVKKYSKVFITPIGPSGKKIENFWTFSLGINKDSKHKVEAWKVLTFLTGKEAMQAFAERTKWPNVTMKSVLYSDVLINTWGRDQIEINERSIIEANPYYMPYIPELNEFMDKIGTAASDAVAGRKTVDQALKDLQDWALKYMTERGYYD